MEEFPASKVQLQPAATLLTRKFPIRSISRRYWPQFGCGQRAKLSPSVAGARIIQMAHSSYSWTSNPLGHPKLSISQAHFPSKDILSFLNLLASKNFACWTDILRNRSVGCLWLIMISLTAVYPSLFQWRLIGSKRAVSKCENGWRRNIVKELVTPTERLSSVDRKKQKFTAQRLSFEWSAHFRINSHPQNLKSVLQCPK